MDDEERKDFTKIKKRFIKAIKEKRLIVDGTTLVYTVSRFSKFAAGDKLTLNRFTGKDYAAMDGFKETQKVAQYNALLSALCGKEKSYIARLDMLDRDFLSSVVTLFLAD